MMNRQALAAFRPAAFQHCAAVLGRHPGPEAVLFRASAVVWLISSLRHNCSPLNSPESENLEFTGKTAEVSKKKRHFSGMMDRSFVGHQASS